MYELVYKRFKFFESVFMETYVTLLTKGRRSNSNCHAYQPLTGKNSDPSTPSLLALCTKRQFENLNSELEI